MPLIRRFPVLWRSSRRLRYWYHARAGTYPDWSRLLRNHHELWESARASASGPPVLLGTGIGAQAHAVTLESALAVALTLRGAPVHVLLCDQTLPACAECDATFYPDLRHFVQHGPARDLCRNCHWPAEKVFRRLGVVTHRYGDWLSADDHAQAKRLAAIIPPGEVRDYRFEGLALGEHAHAGALRFFATSSLAGEAYGELVLRRYLRAALLAAYALRRLLRHHRYACATFSHGIYVPWGVMGEVARQEGVRVVNWNVAYRKQRFIFSHDDTYHHTLLLEPPAAWAGLRLSARQEEDLTSYLASRRHGLFDWIVFHRPVLDDPARIARELALDPMRPVVGLLTNVSWDAQIHYPAKAFPTMLDWLVETCAYFAGRPELQLVIRIHPAELSGFPPSRQPALAALQRRFPVMPQNIRVIPPNSPASTYAVMSLCNAAIIYGTKMGVELTSLGLPVIVAGEAWVRNKGFTYDAASKQDYFALLDRLPFADRLSPQLVSRARRYAYHFFFRRMIRLPFMEPRVGYPIYRLRLRSLADLLPGVHPGLDVVCDGILRGQAFVVGEPADGTEQVRPSRPHGGTVVTT